MNEGWQAFSLKYILTSKSLTEKNLLALTFILTPQTESWSCVSVTNVSLGQSAVSERHPCLAQSEVLASAVWSDWQKETKRRTLQRKKTKLSRCGGCFQISRIGGSNNICWSRLIRKLIDTIWQSIYFFMSFVKQKWQKVLVLAFQMWGFPTILSFSITGN